METPSPTPQHSLGDVLKRPVWSFDDLAIVLDMPPSSLEQLIYENPPAGMFKLGRRRYIRPADLDLWLDEMAVKFEFVPRRNRPRVKVAA